MKIQLLGFIPMGIVVVLIAYDMIKDEIFRSFIWTILFFIFVLISFTWGLTAFVPIVVHN